MDLTRHFWCSLDKIGLIYAYSILALLTQYFQTPLLDNVPYSILALLTRKNQLKSLLGKIRNRAYSINIKPNSTKTYLTRKP